MIETHLPKADGDGVYTKYLTSPTVTTVITPCRGTWLCSGVFESGSAATGGTVYAVAVSGGSPIGNNCGQSSIDGFLVHVLFILTPMFASTLESKGGAVCGNSASTDLCGG